MSALFQPRPMGVYVHIPFCRTKCPYCAFNSAALSEGPDEKAWAGLLRKDLEHKVRGSGLQTSGASLRSIYLGGGTPSLFSPAAIGEIIAFIKETLGMSTTGEDETCGAGAIEVTLEANPGDLDRERLIGYLGAGVNRLSIGVQSLDDRDLQTLGRRHSAGQALSSMRAAREAGFSNLSIDLMYGLPGQDMGAWQRTLEGVLDFRPEHVSLYCLSIEEGTPFFGRYGREEGAGGREKPFIDEETEAAMYEAALKALGGAGYVHYELSNFALAGHESVHNKGYWLGREYLGLGPGAHSFVAGGRWGQRSWNEADINTYRERLLSGRGPAAGSEDLTRDEALVEAVFLGLRMPGTGLDLGRFRRDFGDEAYHALRSRCARYESMGLLRVSGGRAALCDGALFISNEVSAGLLG